MTLTYLCLLIYIFYILFSTPFYGMIRLKQYNGVCSKQLALYQTNFLTSISLPSLSMKIPLPDLSMLSTFCPYSKFTPLGSTSLPLSPLSFPSTEALAETTLKQNYFILSTNNLLQVLFVSGFNILNSIYQYTAIVQLQPTTRTIAGLMLQKEIKYFKYLLINYVLIIKNSWSAQWGLL